MRISDWSSDVCSSEGPGQVMERSPWMLGSSPSMTIARMMESPTAAAPFPLCSPHHQCSPCTAQQGALLYDLTGRSDEHKSELQSLMTISFAVFCLKKKIKNTQQKKSYDNR